ncbi:hypothetical protein SeLEV6574_g01771 [Synchytrium endobioticum]|uniref:Uncharacterized protein n=1 Tax=Synchytrium endobioticum TaxID=286115 RepID=A0A507DDI1_9FUNG|nr:hypothetical protein SeLEV6574_g01771 [Synchytrium endobioticum]
MVSKLAKRPENSMSRLLIQLRVYLTVFYGVPVGCQLGFVDFFDFFDFLFQRRIDIAVVTRMVKFITISLLAYVAAFFCFTPVEATDQQAVLDLISHELARANNPNPISTIDDVLLHIHNRINVIISDRQLKVNAATLCKILHECNDDMSAKQMRHARSYLKSVFDGLNGLFHWIAFYMNEAQYLPAQEALQRALALVAPHLKWHYDLEAKYRPSAYASHQMETSSLPPYDWEGVVPLVPLSDLEQETRDAGFNIPASGPVTLRKSNEVDTWIREIQLQKGICKRLIDELQPPRDSRFHRVTAKTLIAPCTIRQDVFESTAEWGCPHTYADLHQLASESQIWQRLFQHHKELMIVRATYDLRRVEAYRLYKPDERKDQVATIMRQLKRFIRKYGGDPNTAQTSAVPDCSNVHDAGTSTAPSEQTGPELSYFGGAILKPPTGYMDPAYRHDETTFGYPAFDHGGPAGANSDRDSPEGPSDVGCFIRNYHHPDY